jgi:hypothetical protein
METATTTPKPVSTAKRRQIEADEARAVLLKMLTRGQRVFAEQTHTSASGTTRRYRVLVILRNDICDITRLTARATKREVNDRGIKVTGGNFSGEVEIKDELARVLFGGYNDLELGRI